MAFAVSELWNDAKKILGKCDEAHLLTRLSQAVEILANSGDYDCLMGYLDICVQGRTVTLPREVDTILHVNVGGQPTVGRDMFYRFHLNGTGDCTELCEWSWDDRGLVPGYRDLAAPSKLVAFVQNEEDEGAELWVYGYDSAGQELRSQVGGVWKSGYQVPTIFGYAVPDAGAPLIARYTRVRKAATTGSVRLSSWDNDAVTGTLLGIFDADETEPQYRRIVVNTDCSWVRIGYRKAVLKFRATTDLVPLPSSAAVLFMLRALKLYDEGDMSRGAAFEATARRFLEEAQRIHTPPVATPFMVNESCGVVDHSDFVD